MHLRLAVRSRHGFMLLDALLGIAMFTIFVGAVATSVLYSQRNSLGTGDRMRAVFLSEQTLEAARSVRDSDFDALQAGTFGIGIDGDGQWELVGTESVTEDGFTTSITLVEDSEDTFSAMATTLWDHGPDRSGTVELTTILTDWRAVKEIGDWSSVTLIGQYIDGGTPSFNNMDISETYAFVTSETDGSGPGLYVFDTSDLATPTRVAAGFSLGADGYDVLVNGTVLYVLTSDGGGEIRAYDISAPDLLDPGNLIATANLPGSGRGRSLAFFNGVVFVGTAESATDDEFFSFDGDDLTVLDSLNVNGGLLDLSLHEGYAYAASGDDVAELHVIDIFDPEDLQDAPGVGYNLTDVQDGRAVATFGTSALLGRNYGDITEELVLFSLKDSPVPSPPPGPWYHDVGEGITGIAVDPSGTYAFLSSIFDQKELQVISPTRLAAGLAPELTFYNTDTGFGLGVAYDLARDRVFLLTTTALEIFAPQ